MTGEVANRLLVSSNRLPYDIDQTADGLSLRAGIGGLVTAMDPILRQRGGTWVGWAGHHRKVPESVEVSDEGSVSYRLRPIRLSADEVAGYYGRYSNRCLWPLFHGFQEYCEFSRDAWRTYESVNRRFAECVVREYRVGDVIWIHDYHLLLTPRLIRERLPDARIAFFLHIPFPAAELFRIVPQSKELLAGLLGADLIGFHIEDDCRNFVEAAGRTDRAFRAIGADRIRYAGRDSKLGAFPISIDHERFAAIARRPRTQARAAAIRDGYRAEILAIGVDRLDYTKGVLERLYAIEHLLEAQPDLRGRFTFIQISAPSRSALRTYRAMRDRIERMVGRINGRFSGRGCIPIDYRFESHAQEELVAYYLAADLALITPLRDGMNLVAKEYVAARVDGGGLLVLSRFAGAAEELSDAVLVNPYDAEGLAQALHEAIRMPKREKRRRMKLLGAQVARHDVHAWARRFLRAAGRPTPRMRPPSGASANHWGTGEAAGRQTVRGKEWRQPPTR